MRRVLVTALTTAALLPFGGTASAGTCTAYGTPPHLLPGRPGYHASGTFACAEETAGMSVTVCIEELTTTELGPGWGTLGCASASEKVARSVTASVVAEIQIYTVVLRTTVTGTNQAGDAGSFTSPPTVWPNCACSIF